MIRGSAMDNNTRAVWFEALKVVLWSVFWIMFFGSTIVGAFK